MRICPDHRSCHPRISWARRHCRVHSDDCRPTRHFVGHHAPQHAAAFTLPFDPIPGIILLGANGLLPLWVLWLVIRRNPRCGLWTAFQGCVLLGWLVVECWMLRMVIWPHYLYGALAVALIVCGLALRREPVRHAASGISNQKNDHGQDHQVCVKQQQDTGMVETPFAA